MRLLAGLSFVLTLALATVDVNAQGRGKTRQGRDDSAEETVQNDRTDRNTTAAINVSIGRSDEHTIHEWFSRAATNGVLPPGLAKKEQLPPGLQKQLARNGQLPPGLQKRVQPLPPALEARLTRLPEGRRRVMLNGSVILLDERKNLILDVVAVF